MAFHIPPSTLTTGTPAFTFPAAGDQMWLPQGHHLVTENQRVISSAFGDVTAYIDGEVFQSGGNWFAAYFMFDSSLIVGPTGSLSGYDSAAIVRMDIGPSFLDNAGRITSVDGTAVQMQASGGNLQSILNSGSIHARGMAISVLPGGAFELRNEGSIHSGPDAPAIDLRGVSSELFNSGTITSSGGAALQVRDPGSNTRLVNWGMIQSLDGWGIQTSGAFVDSLEVINHGSIGGGTGAVFAGDFGARIVNNGVLDGQVRLGSGANRLDNHGTILGDVATAGGDDNIRNTGLITGAVNLDDGDNSFNGRGGTVLGEIASGTGNDTIFGGDGDDVIVSNNGRNHLSGGPGDDSITGGTGNDVIRGGAGDDVLNGRTGNDEIRGGAGDDWLEGRGGDDTLIGGEGNDTLIGGGGVDVLTGGSGADVFLFTSAGHIGTGSQSDRITDFAPGVDVIDLSGFGMSLTFIGTDPFSGTAGEIRFNDSAGVLQGDITGNGSLDFRLWLDGVSSLEAGDLIL